MEDFRFVHESPQSQQMHRKRPRLVTACDNCRIKKIRCVKPATNEKCEACTAGHTSCDFRDRERYFQERSRLIAGSTAGVSSPGSRRPTTPSTAYIERDSRSPYARPRRIDDSPPSSIYSRYSDSTPHTPGTPSRPPSLSYSADSNNSLWSYPSDVNTLSPSYSHSTVIPLQLSHHPNIDHLQLFEPSFPAYPSSTVMPHLVSLFFEHFGAQCPYLSQNDIISRFYNQTLPAAIANSIASLAVRYTELPQLQSRGLRSVADEYSVNAKNNLASILPVASLDTLHALMLLSLSEYRRSQTAGYARYADMAFRMGMDLGLSDTHTLQMLVTASPRERQRLQLTWDCILELHSTALSCTYVCRCPPARD
ncbi:hypothetical protein NEOLEDRAFT_1080881 [Neolentinus lepideus HHB14362 ss-1]|uniref:Zn(2)-C6 fungal-type domain-containing protein n=1 Tax=Neolentinus lepideus HHB14362 ss-1 TaxID=1314782 RepID=A0A165MC09_9AGAM|nr:hypothetical protein NEOLEDRAFT_1080881 [Neolentinus lepideus HHB14362 ss-1]